VNRTFWRIALGPYLMAPVFHLGLCGASTTLKLFRMTLVCYTTALTAEERIKQLEEQLSQALERVCVVISVTSEQVLR
jgi:hypothetical protein